MVEEEERICAVEMMLCQKYLFLTFYFTYSKLNSLQYHALIAAAYDARRELSHWSTAEVHLIISIALLNISIIYTVWLVGGWGWGGLDP